MKNIITILLILLGINTFSQDQKNICIRNIENKEALPYSNVAVTNSSKGTIANQDGFFVLDSTIFSPGDSLLFCHMGFESLSLPYGEVIKKRYIYLKPAIINLETVLISDRQLTGEEIIKKVDENFQTNHANAEVGRLLFFRHTSETPYDKSNMIEQKKNTLFNLPDNYMDTIINYIPEKTISYEEGYCKFINHDTTKIITPKEGVKLISQDEVDFIKILENMDQYFKDIEHSLSDSSFYFRLGTGILSFKLSDKNLQINTADTSVKDNDSIDYLPVLWQKRQIHNMINNAVRRNGALAFLEHQNHYNFIVKDIVNKHNDFLYKIEISPKRRGEYKGEVYINTNNFAIVELNIRSVKGKKFDNVDLLGFENFKHNFHCKAIFEKYKGKYHVKYCNSSINEFTRVDRSFFLKKKKKRFLFNKTIGVMKLNIDYSTDTHKTSEVLVTNFEDITPESLQIIEPEKYPFKKVVVDELDLIQQKSILLPEKMLDLK
jgi:hypothetical protein